MVNSGKWALPSYDPFLFCIQMDFIILTVWFGKEGEALKYWKNHLAKVNKNVAVWNFRQLTIKGKILVPCNEILPVF